MRRPSARCQPHVCTIRYNSWNTDQDGGRKVKATRVRSGIPCFVQPGKSETVIETSDTDGLRRVTQISPGNVYFVSDVQLTEHDLIQWTDTLGVTHTYLVIGYNPPCATNVCFQASIEERI